MKEKISHAPVNATPGSFDDDSIVRGAVAEAIRKSPKSREVIAEEISQLTGRTVTLQMMNGWTGESQQSHSFPIRLLRAFCAVTDNWALLHVVLGRASKLAIDEWEKPVLELGERLVAKRLHECDAEDLCEQIVRGRRARA